MLSREKVLTSSGQRGPLFLGAGAAAPAAPPQGRPCSLVAMSAGDNISASCYVLRLFFFICHVLV
jgi:hypothetical protein